MSEETTPSLGKQLADLINPYCQCRQHDGGPNTCCYIKSEGIEKLIAFIKQYGGIDV